MAINIDNLETVLSTKIAAATSSTPDKDLLLISKSVEALDSSTSLKPEDIGVIVQAYDANAATTSDVTTAVAALVDSAPGTLDTLNELAAALGDDPNHVTTMTTMIDGKVDDAQVLTDVPVSAVFTDTIYTKPSAEPISYITGLTTALDAKETADANISKTDVAETRTANVNLLTYTETTISTSGTIDLSLGTVFTHTHTGGMSSFTLSNVPTTGTSGFILILENGGAYPLTWWTGVVWPAATPPILTAAGTDVFTFTTPDSGTTWYGIPSGIGMA
jgi:hypothetical protein